MMKVPYDHRLQPIDEQLVKLVARRWKLSRGANAYPDGELLKRWCEEYDISMDVLAPVFASMCNPRRPMRLPVSPQHLQGVIPVMKRVTVDGVTYQICRVEQYDEASLVHVDVFTGEDAEMEELNVQLMLVVEPFTDRQVQLNRGQMGGNQASMAYMVTPKLPDDLASATFRLEPYPFPHRRRPPERVLDQPVAFE